MPPTPPQEPVDPTALALSRAIRSAEGGDYANTSGDAGTSAGAYQWNNYVDGKSQKLTPGQPPSNFSTAAQKFGLDPTDFSSTNQDHVAYEQIKEQLDAGHSQSEVASWWNSGNYDSAGNKGYNSSLGVSYDTPAYVQKVQKAYEQEMQSPGSTAAAPQVGLPTTPLNIPSGATPEAQPESFLQKAGDIAGGVGNFLFPIAGDVYNDVTGNNKKTALQQVGDAGTSALGVASLIPGADAVADPIEAARGADLAATGASKAPGILSAVAKNGALGAGFGASGALGQGQTSLGGIAQSAAIGAGTGGILGAGGHLLGKALANAGAEDATSRLTAQKNRLKTLNNTFNNNSTSVTDPITTLDQAGLTKDLKVTNGKIDASKLTNPDRTGSIDNMIEDHSNMASGLVKGMQGTVPLEDFKSEAESAIKNDPTIRGGLAIPKALANLESMLSSAEMSYGKDLPYSAIDEIRAGMNKGFNPDEMDTKRVIGNTARSFLYNGDGANTALKSAMQNESELIKARNFTEKLHGTTVPGGQLGKYFADLIGAGVGGAAGSMFGPLGEAVGTGVGGYTTHKIGDAIQSNYFNPLGGRTARGILNVLQSKGGKIATGAAKAGILNGVSKL